MDERLRAPWHPAEAIPVILLALLGTSFVAALLIVLVDEALGFTLALMTLPVALAVTTLLWIRLRHPEGVSVLGLSPDRPREIVTGGLLWGVGLFAFTTFVIAPLFFALMGLLTGEPVEAPRQELLPADPETLHIVLGGISAIVAAPIGEELFFRGLLHTALRARMGFWLAATISSAIFAAVHVIPLLMPMFFVVGLGLALVYERRGSLLAPIAAHAAFNLVGYVIFVGTME